MHTPTYLSLGLVVLAALALALTASSSIADHHEKSDVADAPPVLNFKMKSLDGKEIDLARKYRGKVILMVNVASKCGYTPQYKGLQELHEKYADKGLAILGFPCNQFGGQEPGTSEDIAQFCEANYGVTFDMFEKIEVNGDDQAPLYKHLTSEETNPASAGPIKWNFEKFLISADGRILKRYSSRVKPESEEMTGAIEAALAARNAS